MMMNEKNEEECLPGKNDESKETNRESGSTQGVIFLKKEKPSLLYTKLFLTYY